VGITGEGAQVKILAINGSPRTNGNTSLVLKDLLAKAEAAGAHISYYDLADLNIKDCKACMKCKKEDCCSQKDDMETIRPLIQEADLLVLGSPIYMGDQTGLMKCFIDRLYTFMGPSEKKGELKSRLSEGKKAMVIFTCQMPNGNQLYNYIVVRYFNLLVNMLGYSDIRTYIIGGANPFEDLRNTPQGKSALDNGGNFVLECLKAKV
jgi:multimeric flavodoxin WrbA